MDGGRRTSDELGVASTGLPYSAVRSDEPAPPVSIYLEGSRTWTYDGPRPRPVDTDNDPDIKLARDEMALDISPNQIPSYGGRLLGYAAPRWGESYRGFHGVVFSEWRISLQAPRGGPALATSSVYLSAPSDVLGGDPDAARRSSKLGPWVRSRHGSIRSHPGSVRYLTARMERLLFGILTPLLGYSNAATRSSSEPTILPPLAITNVSTWRLTATPSSPAWRKSERSPKQVFSRAAA